MSSHSLLNGRGLNDKDCREPAVTSTGLKFWYNSSGKPYIVHSSTTPTASASGYAIGCEWLNTATGIKYRNTGTATSATWDASVTTGSAAQSFGGNVTVGGNLVVDGTTTMTGAIAANGNVTVQTGNTLDGTDADTVRSGGIIVPTDLIIPFTVQPHASQLTYNLFYARGVGYTVTGVGVVMDLVDDTAITASICKVTGNNVAVAATTPLHTGTFNMQTTAGTPQVGTLTSTGADLILAATNKIGIIFSGALDVGIVNGWITLKRS